MEYLSNVDGRITEVVFLTLLSPELHSSGVLILPASLLFILSMLGTQVYCRSVSTDSTVRQCPSDAERTAAAERGQANGAFAAVLR